MSRSATFEVLKPTHRWRAGQNVECLVGTTLPEEGPGALHAIDGATSAAAFRLRLMPGGASIWEARVRKLVTLGHPGIVAIVGLGTLEGNAFVVEEVPDGPSLRLWAQRRGGPVALEHVARIAEGIASALEHAHAAQVVHGGLDASCVNVAFNPPRHFDVRVSSFGLCDELRAQRLPLAGEHWDSVSPEVMSGAKPSPASDLFSAAVTVIEALTGARHPIMTQRPWREVVASPRELRAALARQRDDVPDAVWNLLGGILAADPKARTPATARELAAQLRKTSWEPRTVLHNAPRERPREGFSDAPRTQDAPKIAATFGVPSLQAPDVTMQESHELASPGDTVPLRAPVGDDGTRVAPSPISRGPNSEALRSVLRGAGRASLNVARRAEPPPVYDDTQTTIDEDDEGSTVKLAPSQAKMIAQRAVAAYAARGEDVEPNTLPIERAGDQTALIESGLNRTEVVSDDAPDVTLQRRPGDAQVPVPVMATTLPVGVRIVPSGSAPAALSQPHAPLPDATSLPTDEDASETLWARRAMWVCAALFLSSVLWFVANFMRR